MFSGSFVALVTPFNEKKEVDYPALKQLVAWHIQEGTDGIICCGTTGEASTLSHEEQFEVLQAILEVAEKKIPILMGTGTNNTRTTIEKTKQAQKMGADGCLVIIPYYNRPTAEGCLEHFKAVSQIGLPTLVYHHPGRTGTKLTATTLLKLTELPSIVGIKESSGDLDLAMELLFSGADLLAGDDLWTLPLMSLGAKGVISVVANVIPKEWKKLVTALFQGDYPLARGLTAKYHALCKALFIETNPQGIKYALSLCKKCRADLRLPLLEPQKTTQQRILEALQTAQIVR